MSASCKNEGSCHSLLHIVVGHAVHEIVHAGHTLLTPAASNPV